jgi:hypothetical protein
MITILGNLVLKKNAFMKTIYILLLLLGSMQIVSAQNYLNIKNSKTGKVKVIENDKTIFFKITGDSSFNKGIIQQIKDSSVVIYLPDEDENSLVEYRISEFSAIRKLGKFHSITRIVSIPLLMVGGIGLIAGIPSTLSSKKTSVGLGGDTIQETNNQGPILMAVGGGALALGLLPYLIKPKTYDFKKDCILEIRKD